MLHWLKTTAQQLGGAVIFYTCLPLPPHWPLDFTRIARWAPMMGLLIGGILAALDRILAGSGMPIQPRSALLVALWVGLTGGLHLDGAMDTADGLAAMEPERRLSIMADSRSGAFGGMAAVILLSLKICALMALTHHRSLALITVPVWGRWGQVVAISQYVYLKPTGKGEFHHRHWQSPQDWIPGLLILMGLIVWQHVCQLDWRTIAWVSLWGSLLTWAIGAWFDRQLGGMTGDVYGAVVEWSEALLLCCLATLWSIEATPFT